MGLWIKSQGLENFLGFLTVLITMGIAFTLWLSNDSDLKSEMTAPNIALSLALFSTYLVGFFIAYGEYTIPLNVSHRLFGILLSFISLVLLLNIFYFAILGILVTLLVYRLPHLIHFKHSMVISIAIPILFVSYDYFIKQTLFHFPNMCLFIIFNILATTSTYRFISEKKAKNKVTALVRELNATQLLLSSIVKRDERLRISRDLHDTLGHQLIALNLQLEVAHHVESNERHKILSQARQICTEILSSVRSTVSNMRDDNKLELNNAIYVLTKNIPGLSVSTELSDNIESLNAQQSEAIFRCIQEALTNTIKHSSATECCIRFHVSTHRLKCTISDNGRVILPIHEGNGLRGMRERLTDLGGELDISSNSDNGFKLDIYVPIDG